MVTEAIHRVTYDATVDDAVDVAWRLASRTAAVQKQLRLNVLICSAIAGLAFTGYVIYSGATAPSAVMFAIAGGVVFAAFVGRLYRHFLVKDTLKLHRKIIAEQFGGSPTVRCEVELRPDALWARHLGMEMLFPWNICTTIVDNGDDIEMNFSPGICVVRSRYFATPAEREAFLATARRLSDK